MSRAARIFFRVGVSLALLAAVFWKADLREIGRHLAAVSPGWLLAALALLFLGTFITALRWRVLIRVHGQPPPLFYLMRVYLYSVFLNNFFPSTVGADPVRAALVPRTSIPLSVSLVTVVVERIIGLFALLILTLVFLPVSSARLSLPIPWLPVVLAAAGGLVLAWRLTTSTGWLERLRSATAGRPVLGRLAAILDKVVAPLSGFFGAPWQLLTVLGLTIVLQANVVFFVMFLGRSLGIHLPLLAYFAFVPLTRMVISIPLTINGIGLREGAMGTFLGVWGVAGAADLGAAISWLEMGVVLVEGLIGWMIWVAFSWHDQRQPPAGPSE